MPAMLFPRACTWCNGDLYLGRDHLGMCLKCLRCGRDRVIPEDWIEVDDDRQTTPPSAVHEPGTPYDPAGAVLAWLRGHPGWHPPADIKDALNLDRSTWNRSIRVLLTEERVERMGEKRGTKYRVSVDGCHPSH